jgi:hypothetical protein
LEPVPPNRYPCQSRILMLERGGPDEGEERTFRRRKADTGSGGCFACGY